MRTSDWPRRTSCIDALLGRGAGDLGTVPGKSSISSRYLGYHLAVATHLTALSKTVPGGTMLTALANSAVHTTSIVDHPLSNQCGAQGSTNGMNAVAKELFAVEGSKIGDATKAALNKAPKLSGSSAKWLAQKINTIPRYQLKGGAADGTLEPWSDRGAGAEVGKWQIDLGRLWERS